MIATTNCRHGVPPAECERCKRVAQLTEALQALRQPSMCRHGLALGVCHECIPRPRRRLPRPRTDSAACLILEALAAAAPLVTFRREDIVMYAWERFPLVFGMREHAHPDTTKVFCVLDGKRGLVARGYLVKSADGYRLAEEVTDAA